MELRQVRMTNPEFADRVSDSITGRQALHEFNLTRLSHNNKTRIEETFAEEAVSSREKSIILQILALNDTEFAYQRTQIDSNMVRRIIRQIRGR